QDLLTAYCTAVDSLEDMEALLDCFTDDAVFDLSGIDLPRFEGREQIRGFFVPVFKDMSHHGHFNTNLAIDSLEGDEATCRAYIMGMGATHDDRSVLVYVRYFLKCVRTAAGWKIKHFSEAGLMPLPSSLTDIHGRD
ncbi:MAG: nuclear transport factor 2 family protein, partial [Bacteroidales bacterium]|nr:nuclear transport factor 2 family protein [Bacteroidales bacterium]